MTGCFAQGGMLGAGWGQGERKEGKRSNSACPPPSVTPEALPDSGTFYTVGDGVPLVSPQATPCSREAANPSSPGLPF